MGLEFKGGLIKQIKRTAMAPNTITRYSDNTQISSISELPVSFDERIPTDCFCTIITSIFAICMLAYSALTLNIDNLRQVTYPTDSMGRRCTLDNNAYNYLYFVDPSDITRRVCVNQCPKQGDKQLSCWQTDDIGCQANENEQFRVTIYPSEPLKDTALGLFCLPYDEETKKLVLINSKMDTKFEFVKGYRSLWIGAAMTFGASIIFLILTFLSPKVILYFSIVLGGISYFALSALLLYQSIEELKTYAFAVILIGLILLAIGIMIMTSLCMHRNELYLAINYLRRAVMVMKDQIGLFLLIPVFIALTIGLLALCAFQNYAIWSNSQKTFVPEQVYYELQGGTMTYLLQFLNIVQFIWGLCFLKSTYNFLISGSGVTYALWDSSKFLFGLKAFFRFHWGSVVGGSFMINFFFIPDLLFDFIRPDQDKNPQTFKSFNNICCLCDRVLGLVREESMAFTIMTGLPYCNSSRVSQKIYFMNDDPIDGSNSQSVGRYFRLGGHSLLASIGTLFCFFSMYTNGNVYIPIVLFSYLLNIFASTYFVCLLADLSESLLMCDLVEMYLNNENQKADRSQDISRNRAKSNGGRDFYESNVNQGYDIVPTNHY